MGELYNPFPKLPKNIRQIGEKDEHVKLYLEDYVITYLKRLYPTGVQSLRVGLLLGTVEQQDGVPYIFIDGAMEMEDVETTGEKVVFGDASWKKAYQTMEENFPKRSVQGWFLCGAPGCQLSPLNYWKQHSQYFSGRHQLMYLNSGLEGEEALYVTSEDGFYQLKGHSIYYERNQLMQDYMVLRKDARRVETGSNDRVIRDFRQRMGDRRLELSEKKSSVHLLGVVCSALSVAVLAGGIVMFNNYNKMKEMESALVSVLPQSTQKRTELKEGVIIEELPGNVQRTTEAVPEPTQAPTEPSVEVEVWQGIEGSTEEAFTEATQPLPPTETLPEQTWEAQVAATEAIPPEEEVPVQGGNATASQDYQESTQATEVAAVAGQSYVVGEGETLYGICYKHYQSLDKLNEICELNGINDVNKIIAGQKLILP